MSPRLIERLKQIERLEGWCTHAKAIHFAELILQRKPSLCVEIGVWGGRGAIAMGMACQEVGAGEVIGIDPWTPAAALEGGVSPEHDEWWAKVDYGAIQRGADAARFALGVEDVVRFIPKHDTEVLGEFTDGSIDILHLDSNHAEVTSVRSVRDWVPKLKIGGVFVMDDTTWPTTQRAIELLRNDLGTRHVSTHDMTDSAGTVNGQYMVFQKL